MRIVWADRLHLKRIKIDFRDRKARPIPGSILKAVLEGLNFTTDEKIYFSKIPSSIVFLRSKTLSAAFLLKYVIFVNRFNKVPLVSFAHSDVTWHSRKLPSSQFSEGKEIIKPF